MCIHKYSIFKQCGHSYFSPKPLLLCPIRAAQCPTPEPTSKSTSSTPRRSCKRPSEEVSFLARQTTCTPTAHPYRTHLISTGLCLSCELSRARSLALAERNISLFTLPERKWRVRYTLPTKSGLEGAFPEGGWAQGSDIDVNALVRREREEEKEKKRREESAVGSPVSANSWKTSHRGEGWEDGRRRWRGESSRGDRM